MRWYDAEQVAGANDGWPSQFRFAGDVLVSVMAQLRMLGASYFPNIHFDHIAFSAPGQLFSRPFFGGFAGRKELRSFF